MTGQTYISGLTPGPATEPWTGEVESAKQGTYLVIDALTARAEAAEEDLADVRNSLGQCLHAIYTFDATNYDDYGGPHLSVGIIALGRRAELAEKRLTSVLDRVGFYVSDMCYCDELGGDKCEHCEFLRDLMRFAEGRNDE